MFRHNTLICINLLKFATGLMNQCLEQLETMPTVFVEISRNRGVFFSKVKVFVKR